jgi:hypothetical protein
MAGPSVTIYEQLAVAKVASVTVTVYVPAGKPLIEEFVLELLHE